MATTLEQLKDELYEGFNQAKQKSEQTRDLNIYNYPEAVKISMIALQAAAETARAITAVEHELADREEKKNGIKLPGKN